LTQDAAAGHWCRRCGKRVTVTGDDPDLARAVHAGSGQEQGADGHLAAPVGFEPEPWRTAREVAADYGGAFDVDARLGLLCAYWKPGAAGPGVTAGHYTAHDEAEMRRQLDIAVAGTPWERPREGAGT